MLYDIARSMMFRMDPERSHDLALSSMNLVADLGLLRLLGARHTELPLTVMGIRFPNPVGLAAGLDKNAAAIAGLSEMGFGFLEVGTVTPRPQLGNPKPRIFRIPEHLAIINRLGLNNLGVDKLVKNIEQSTYKGVLGINIGKNKDTPNEQASDDYLLCLRKVYPYASYVTVNISSPNTPGMRNLQQGNAFGQLLDKLKTEQARLAAIHGRYVPIAVKIAPDMSEEEFVTTASVLKAYEMDAVIATNTTISREGVNDSLHAEELGGLSGAPVRNLSTRAITILARELKGALPIIGLGGITEGFDAAEKIDAGASLVQMYTGFIYQGPKLIRDSVAAIRERRTE